MRPISQITATNGAPTTNVHLNLDGTAPDSGNYYAGNDAATGVCEVLLTDLSSTPPDSGTCTVVIYQAQCDGNVAPSTGGSAPSYNLEVYEGATQRASFASPVTPSEGTFTLNNSLTFSSSAITDWSDVRVRFTSNGTGGSPAVAVARRFRTLRLRRRITRPRLKPARVIRRSHRRRPRASARSHTR